MNINNILDMSENEFRPISMGIGFLVGVFFFGLVRSYFGIQQMEHALDRNVFSVIIGVGGFFVGGLTTAALKDWRIAAIRKRNDAERDILHAEAEKRAEERRQKEEAEREHLAKIQSLKDQEFQRTLQRHHAKISQMLKDDLK